MTDVDRELIYLDANAFIFFGEGHPDFGPRIRRVFRSMNAGKTASVTSELTLAEILVGPVKTNRPEIIEAYEALLTPRPGFKLVAISQDILRSAAKLRASLTIKLPDAIHVATAVEQECGTFITEDRRLKLPAQIKLQSISELSL